MASWDAAVYDRFAAERERPSRDLIARLGGPPPRKIVDLGCGSGLSTLALAQTFPQAEIVGVDTSAAMLAVAAMRIPTARFVLDDVANLDVSGFDLVFANAVMQWIPDHIKVLRRIAQSLSEGGRLAVQSPDNQDEPSHRAMREVAVRLGLPVRQPREKIGSFADYETALAPLCAELDLWRTTYAHRLNLTSDIVKWVEGTGLRPFVEGLDEAKRAAFMAAYHEAVAAAYPPSPTGKTLFPFPRLFLVATRGRG